MMGTGKLVVQIRREFASLQRVVGPADVPRSSSNRINGNNSSVASIEIALHSRPHRHVCCLWCGGFLLPNWSQSCPFPVCKLHKLFATNLPRLAFALQLPVGQSACSQLFGSVCVECFSRPGRTAAHRLRGHALLFADAQFVCPPQNRAVSSATFCGRRRDTRQSVAHLEALPPKSGHVWHHGTLFQASNHHTVSAGLAAPVRAVLSTFRQSDAARGALLRGFHVLHSRPAVYVLLLW